ncbi:MAG: hypothetical protein ACXVGI_03425 [Mycobacteriaceae bacterium]
MFQWGWLSRLVSVAIEGEELQRVLRAEQHSTADAEGVDLLVSDGSGLDTQRALGLRKNY